MRKIKLITTSGAPLYEGFHSSQTEAIEHAITHHINLDSIDLSGAILCNINLDCVKIRGANFQGADLTGANMSEADFINCDFSGATLTQACCCYSNFINCHFKETTLESTDISMASLDSCAFEGLSVFNLNFYSAFELALLTYRHLNETYHFKSPPIAIRAQDRFIVIIDNNGIQEKIYHSPPSARSLTLKVHRNQEQSVIEYS